MTYVLMTIFMILETLNLNWLFFNAQEATHPRNAKTVSVCISSALIYLYTIVITQGKL
jgi:hypothetical protein